MPSPRRYRFTSAPDRKLRQLRQNGGTVYRQLLARGFAPDDITAAAESNAELRSICLTVAAQDGTDVPIVGVSYGGDFRAEEEWGLPEISTALKNGDGHQRVFTGNVDGHFYFGIHADGGLAHWNGQAHVAERATEALRRSRAASQWRTSREDRFKTVAELRTDIRDAGITGALPRTKAALQELHREKVRGILALTSVGEFHYGDTLIMLPATPILEATLRILADSGKHLRMGGSSGPFSRSFTLFDERDLTGDSLESERAREDYIRRMNKKAEPVATELRRHGSLYYLGPGRREGGEDLFWLNFSPRDRQYPQQFGWYTLKQLAAMVATGAWEKKR